MQTTIKQTCFCRKFFNKENNIVGHIYGKLFLRARCVAKSKESVDQLIFVVNVRKTLEKRKYYGKDVKDVDLLDILNLDTIFVVWTIKSCLKVNSDHLQNKKIWGKTKIFSLDTHLGTRNTRSKNDATTLSWVLG